MLISLSLRGTAAVGALMLGLCAAQAQSNPSFETGDFTGWNFLGNNFVIDSSIGSGPTDGTKQALLATATDGTGGIGPGDGASPANLNSFLSLTSTALFDVGNGTPVIGSAIHQSFNLGAGEELKFDWDFLTNQTYNDGTPDSIAPSTVNNDFAFLVVNGQVVKLADTFFGYVADGGAPGGFQTGLTITDVANPFISETGYHTFSWTAPSAGVYKIGVGVVHSTTGPDDGVNSGLLVDNFRATPVPEPATCVVLGLAATALLRRKR